MLERHVRMQITVRGMSAVTHTGVKLGGGGSGRISYPAPLEIHYL